MHRIIRRSTLGNTILAIDTVASGRSPRICGSCPEPQMQRQRASSWRRAAAQRRRGRISSYLTILFLAVSGMQGGRGTDPRTTGRGVSVGLCCNFSIMCTLLDCRGTLLEGLHTNFSWCCLAASGNAPRAYQEQGLLQQLPPQEPAGTGADWNSQGQQGLQTWGPAQAVSRAAEQHGDTGSARTFWQWLWPFGAATYSRRPGYR